MARLLRTFCLAAAPVLVLGALPAAAQFNPFEAIFGSPPRPPGSVPGGRQPPPPQQQAYPQYPDPDQRERYQDPRYQDPRYQDPRSQDPRYQDPRYQDPRSQDPRYQDPRYQDPRYQDPRSQDPRYQDPRYQDPQYPEQARQGPPGSVQPGGVQSQPLPPPPGGTTAAVPPGQVLPPPGQVLPPPGQQPLPSALPGQRPRPPADTAPQPGDEVIVEPPSQKIVNKGALFSGLDKITGRIITFDVAIGETVQFGALQVTPRICYTRPPTETSNTDAFIEVDEVTLQGEVKRIFTGWMFASSPGLHAVEHPIYDVWLTDCKNPVVAAAPVEAAAPPAQPARPQGAPKRPQQTPPGAVPRR